MTDVSNFDPFDSSYSDDDPLTSTPVKLSSDQQEDSSLLQISPVAPSFVPANEQSAQSSVSDTVSNSILEESHAEMKGTPTTDPVTAFLSPSGDGDAHDNQWCGMKIVGDNVDSRVKPRHMRSDHQSTDLHYFHVYATKDRINLSQFSEQPPSLNPDPVLSQLLPTADDMKAMLENLGVLVSRQLTEYIPFFRKHFSDVVVQSISHAHDKEMEQISEVVRC